MICRHGSLTPSAREDHFERRPLLSRTAFRLHAIYRRPVSRAARDPVQMLGV